MSPPPPAERHLVPDESAMLALGRFLASGLAPGDLVALNGELGAGKTHFAKGIAEGLGSSDPVTSPTFSLVNEYRSGPLPVLHFDFYRLDSAEELIRIGWDEYLDEDAVLLVEWADKFPELLPADRTRSYDFAIREDGARLLTRR